MKSITIHMRVIDLSKGKLTKSVEYLTLWLEWMGSTTALGGQKTVIADTDVTRY